MSRERITITLPRETAEYARKLSSQTGKSRSTVIADAIETLRQAHLERELAEGYRAMARESRRFAREAEALAAEAWPDYEGHDAD